MALLDGYEEMTLNIDDHQEVQERLDFIDAELRLWEKFIENCKVRADSETQLAAKPQRILAPGKK